MRAERAAICAGLCALVAVGYAGVGGLEFLAFDDDAYVTDHPLVSGGLSPRSVLAAFTTVHSGNWHPLTWISHMLDVSLFGLTPAGPHWVNAGLHAANAVLAFLALSALTGTRWRAAFAAALFAIHPLRVESVAWVAERKDVLSAFFALLALWAWARWAHGGSRAAWGWALVAYAASLMSKPMAVTFPFLLLLLDAWPLRRGLRVREKLPFFALAGAVCAITLFAQQQGIHAVSLPLRLENALVAYGEYLRRVIAPVRLGALYPWRTAIEARVLLGWALVLAAITALALTQARRRPWLLVGWLWFTGMLVPTIGLVQVGAQAFADRYTYLPFLGLAVAAAFGLAELAQRLPAGRAVTAAIATGALAACALQTRAQVRTWHDTESVFANAVAVTRSNWFAHTELGVAQARRGDFEAARESFEAALRIEPAYPRALANLGRVLGELGETEAARESLARALALEPEIPTGHLAYAMVLERGRRFAEAEEQYAAALADPRGAREARFRLVRLLSVAPDASLRDGARALALCEEGCRDTPCESPEELDVCAMAAMEAGRPALAIERAAQAVQRAGARGDVALAARIDARLASYRRGEPVRLRVSGAPSPEAPTARSPAPAQPASPSVSPGPAR